MLPVPTARFVALAALLAVVVLVVPLAAPWGFVAACAALVVVGAADVAAAVDPSTISVEREVTPTVTLGGDGEARWRLTNPTPRRVRVGVADELAPSLHAGRRRFAVVVPAGATRTERTALHPSRRGRFTPTDLV